MVHITNKIKKQENKNDWKTILDKLESGEIRSANKIEGKWVANKEVKQGILEAFKAGELSQLGGFC